VVEDKQLDEYAGKEFPPGCDWKCYTDNNQDLVNLKKTFKAALIHYMNRGKSEGRSCSCTDGNNTTVIKKVNTKVVEDKQLDGKDFPPDCSWECYLHNNKDLKGLEKTHKAALQHYFKRGIEEGRSCFCSRSYVLHQN